MTDHLRPGATVAPTIRRRPRPGALNASPATPDNKPSDYQVGYARPPKQTRFKPGQSGNPRGRPKGARGFNTMVRDLLEEPVTVRTPRGTKRVSVLEVMLRRQIEQGSKGDHRAILSLIRLYQSVAPAEPAPLSEGTSPSETQSATDQEILAWLQQSYAQGGQPS